MYRKFYLFILLLQLETIFNQDMLFISHLSVILALQRSNETYKYIKRPFRHLYPTHNGNSRFSWNLFRILLIGVICLWLIDLLIQSGDIHPNPGPDSVNSIADFSSSSSEISLHTLINHLSIMHLNVQSIVPKMDLIKCEAQAYDILVCSESWLKPEIKDDSILIETFLPPQRTDRLSRPSGGVVIYAKDSFSLIRRSDLEIRGLEAVWIELLVKGKTILIGGFYRQPNSSNEYFNLLTERFDRAFNTNVADILITGDFNYNMLSNDNNKLKDLMYQYNLKQIITEPTHFTESSSSLIDLFLIRNDTNILHSEVIDPFIPDQVRYHCPILLLLKFLRPVSKTTQRKIWKYAQADFNLYRSLLFESGIENHIESNNNIDQNIDFISKVIADASEKSVPHKIVIIHDHPWINCSIRRLIRKRKRAYKKYKKTTNNHYWETYKHFRNNCASEIRERRNPTMTILSDSYL